AADATRGGWTAGDRNAPGRRDAGSRRGGSEPAAVLPVFKKQQEGADEARRERGDQQPVPGVFKIEKREISGEGFLDLARHRTELPQRIVLQYQRKSERGQNGRQGIATEQWP